MSEFPRLTLYIRTGCHLCMDMQMALEAMAPDAGFSLSVRDVDARNEWAEAYGMKVPVLKLGEREICHFFLDHEAVQQALAEFGANGG